MYACFQMKASVGLSENFLTREKSVDTQYPSPYSGIVYTIASVAEVQEY